MPAETKEEEEKAPVKTEPKEDEDDAAVSKRRKRKEKTEEGGAKKKEKEEEGDEDEEQVDNEEDGMAPEAEPSKARNEVVPGTTKFREDAVHVYGLDFLKTGHMEEIFGQFNHRYVEWINESSANVVFRDAASARKALESLSYPKDGDDPWRRTPDILVHDDLPAIYLQMRLAAPTDKKNCKKSVPSMNPPTYADESNRGRDSRFTMSSLYDRPEKTEGAKPAKRVAQALPSAEVAKRAKRGDRFAATLGEAPVAAEPKDKATDAPAAAAESPAATESQVATLSAEEAAAEAERRQKREARFAKEAADTAKASAAPSDGTAAPSGDAAAPRSEAASDAAAPSGDAEAVAEPASGDAEAAAEAPADKAPEASEDVLGCQSEDVLGCASEDVLGCASEDVLG